MGITVYVIMSLLVPALQAQDVDPQQRKLDSLYVAWAENRLAVPVTLIDTLFDVVPEGYTGNKDSIFDLRLKAIPTVFNLTYNSQVKQYIEFYTQRSRKQVQMMLGLADFYFPILFVYNIIFFMV